MTVKSAAIGQRMLRSACSQPPLLRSRTGPRLSAFAASASFSTAHTMQPKIATGQDEHKVQTEVEELLGNGWELVEDDSRLKKTYHFKTYTKVLDFHTLIGVRSKARNHHAEMVTKSGSLTVYWTTHYPRGLTNKDTSMAKYCDEEASSIGTVKETDAQKCGPSNPSTA